MATTQTVIIDFQADFTSLQTGIDSLEKMGKVDKDVADQFRKTNVEIKRQGDTLTTTANKSQASTQSFGKLADLMKQFPKSGMNRFLLQIGNELAAAGLNAKDFYQKLDPKDAVTKQTSLRNELRQVKEQMQAAALSGGKLGEEYQRLKKRAGELDDTIRDVGNDIKNAGSDTRGIDNVVGSISALAGGYSAVQGAAALFGDESENLQKALLKVNAAMALATGIQQVSNAVQKEGSLIRLKDSVATGVQIATQKIYTFVTGQATVATTAFKVALASTGIGLLVVGLVALVSNLGLASKATRKFKKDLEDLRAGADIAIEEIKSEGEIAILLLEGQGAAQSKISKEKLEQLKAQQTVEEGIQVKLEGDRTRAKRNIKDDSIAEVLISQNKIKQIDEQLKTSYKNSLDITRQLKTGRINIQNEENDEKKKLYEEDAAKQKEINEKVLADARKLRLFKLNDFKAGIELELLAAEEGSLKQLSLQKQLIDAKLKIDLEGEDAIGKQRELLNAQAIKDKLDLEKNFNKAIVAQSLIDEKSRLSAQLENLNLSEEEKLAVKISFLQISGAEELAVEGITAAKRKEINAKTNAAIAAAKIESIRKTANDELALSGATGGIQRRALERVSQDEKLKAEIRINAIKQLADIETAGINRQIKANRDASKVIGADQKSLQTEYEQLLDHKAAAAEATEKKITDITKSEQDKRQANDIAYIQAATAGLQSLADILGSIQANDQAAADNSIKRKRAEVEELLEAGAITEKEARERNRRLETEEKQAKQKAAQQQKNLAVFQALLAIPQAYIAGLTAPFPIGGPIYAAILAGLAGVSAAAIAAKPIPKFASGKKGSYRGLAEVGEIGAELIERADGRMEVATRRSMVYLGAQDKVFTAGETKRMLPQVNREAMGIKDGVEKFDYNKLAKAVSNKGNGTTVNIDKEFISESVADGLSKVNYFDRYYNSKG